PPWPAGPPARSAGSVARAAGASPWFPGSRGRATPRSAQNSGRRGSREEDRLRRVSTRPDAVASNAYGSGAGDGAERPVEHASPHEREAANDDVGRLAPEPLGGEAAHQTGGQDRDAARRLKEAHGGPALLRAHVIRDETDAGRGAGPG